MIRYDENAPEYEWFYEAEQNLDLDFVMFVAVIRGIGVFVVPLGGILGWINIGK